MENTDEIPEKTLAAMWAFFMKTSVPRLMEKKIEGNGEIKKIHRSSNLKNKNVRGFLPLLSNIR